MGILARVTQETNLHFRSITLIVIVSLATLVLLFQLGQSSLIDYDEGIYAVVSKEMFTSGDILTLRFASRPWFEKPPLLFWITSLFYRMFGINEFSSRAPSAFAGILVIFLTYLIADLIYEKRVAIIASLSLLANYEFLRISRSGITDMLLTLFVYLSIYAYIRLNKQDCRWWYLFWASFSCAFLVKSWAALIIPTIIGIDIFLSRNSFSTIQAKHFWLGLILSLLIILPWPLLMYIQYGEEFIDRFITFDLIRRSMTPLQGNIGDALFYYYRLHDIYFPWLMLVPFAIGLSIGENLSKHSKSRILLVLVILVFGLYSLTVNTKIIAYISPFYPALSILIANLFIQTFKTHDSLAFGGVVYAIFFTTLFIARSFPQLSQPLGLLILFSLISYPLFIRIFELLSEKEKNITKGGKSNHQAFFIRRILHYARKLNIYQLSISLIYVLLILIGSVKSIDLFRSTISPIEKISSIAGSREKYHHPLIGLALFDGNTIGILGPVARFYSNRPMTIAWSMEELSELMRENKKAEILLLESFLDPLSNDYDLKIVAKVDPYVYATIQHRNFP
jgi:4-amino-4-deoxy-L-arabinose transferase-like glycosyltransferase